MSLLHDDVLFHNVDELEAVPGLAGLRLQRFPRIVRDQLGFKHHSRGRFFAHRASGCELRFVATGPFVRLALTVHEADASVIVYKGDAEHSHHRLSAGTLSSLFLEEPAFHSQVDPIMLRGGRFAASVWRITFNQDAIVSFHHLDAFGHPVRAPHATELPVRRWLAYGSSITFGGNAFHAANAYVQRAARLLGVDVLNKGLPGSCLCEPSTAEYLAAHPGWDFATLELGVNLAELATPEEFEQRARHLIGTIHRAHPAKTVFVLNIFPNRADHLLDATAPAAINNPLFNAIIPRLVEEVSSPHVQFIDGREVLDDLGGLCTDLVHPSDEGHLRMGENLAALLSVRLPD